jgi:hypothetical protein
LLKGQSLDTIPFKFISDQSSKETYQNALSETFAYKLQPRLPGRFPISFGPIAILPDDPSLEKPLNIDVESIFVDVTLTKLDHKLTLPIAPPMDLKNSLPLRWEHAHKQEWHQQHLDKIETTPSIKMPLLSTLALLLIFPLVFMYEHRKPHIEKIPLSKQSLQQAKETLSNIEKTSGLNATHVSAFVSELTAALRYAFEEKFLVHTHTQTTQEFLLYATSLPEASPLKERMENLLLQIDQIKFSQFAISKDECQKLFLEISTIISTWE